MQSREAIYTDDDVDAEALMAEAAAVRDDDPHPVEARFTGADGYACRWCRSAGLRVFIDPRTICRVCGCEVGTKQDQKHDGR